MQNVTLVPKKKGIYLVLWPDEKSPVFVEKGTGGFFKGKDPNVAICELEKHWIENERILYIGQAGGKVKRKNGDILNNKATLQSRIEQYMQFGQGLPKGHYGGRYIWQLANAKDLIICWKVLIEYDSREEEKEMIKGFKKEHEGKRPFANLQD